MMVTNRSLRITQKLIKKTFSIVEKILERDIPGWQEADNILPQQIEAQATQEGAIQINVQKASHQKGHKDFLFFATKEPKCESSQKGPKWI